MDKEKILHSIKNIARLETKLRDCVNALNQELEFLLREFGITVTKEGKDE